MGWCCEERSQGFVLAEGEEGDEGAGGAGRNRRCDGEDKDGAR